MSRIVSPPRTTVTVNVTQKHINEGQRWSPSKDAIARALHAAGLRRWKSGFRTFTVGKFMKRIEMPVSVQEFVKEFDYDRSKCKPFSFQVDLKAARL